MKKSQMKPHLKYLSNEYLTPFPSIKGKELVPKEGSIDVCCTCRWPEVESEKMAQCDFCKEWFHKFCVEILEYVFIDDN